MLLSWKETLLAINEKNLANLEVKGGLYDINEVDNESRDDLDDNYYDNTWIWIKYMM
jgi:hypothetical protein